MTFVSIAHVEAVWARQPELRFARLWRSMAFSDSFGSLKPSEISSLRKEPSVSPARRESFSARAGRGGVEEDVAGERREDRHKRPVRMREREEVQGLLCRRRSRRRTPPNGAGLLEVEIRWPSHPRPFATGQSLCGGHS